MSAFLALVFVLAVAAGILWLAFCIFETARWNILWDLEDRWYLSSVRIAAGDWGKLVSSASYHSRTVRLDQLATKYMTVDDMEAMATVLQKRLHPDSAVQVSEIRWDAIRIDFYQNNGGIPFVWVSMLPLESSFPKPAAPKTSGNFRDWKMLPVNQ